MVLAALICGDLMERLPTMNDATKYKLNGNNVYSFYLDAETQWDLIIGGKPRYNGTGHGGDMEYLFGTGQAEKIKVQIYNLRLDQAIKGVRHDLKTHTRAMKILPLTIFGVLSSKMKLFNRYNLWLISYKLYQNDGFLTL